jgi:hypothetical protein
MHIINTKTYLGPNALSVVHTNYVVRWQETKQSAFFCTNKQLVDYVSLISGQSFNQEICRPTSDSSRQQTLWTTIPSTNTFGRWIDYIQDSTTISVTRNTWLCEKWLQHGLRYSYQFFTSQLTLIQFLKVALKVIRNNLTKNVKCLKHLLAPCSGLQLFRVMIHTTMQLINLNIWWHTEG